MNALDMETSYVGRKLIVRYKHGSVLSCVLDDDSKLITFSFRKQREIVHDITEYIVPEGVYLSQFGITVTESGEFFFIQSWEKGLFCFDMQTGNLVWHQKIKKPYQLLTYGSDVICRSYSQGIFKIDLCTGDIQTRFPLGDSANFFALNDVQYLIGPKRGKYHVIDNQFNLLVTIPCQQLNPYSQEIFIICNAVCVEGGIQISGFEYSGKVTKVNDYRFSRIINVEVADKKP